MIMGSIMEMVNMVIGCHGDGPHDYGFCHGDIRMDNMMIMSTIVMEKS